MNVNLFHEVKFQIQHIYYNLVAAVPTGFNNFVGGSLLITSDIYRLVSSCSLFGMVKK